MSTSHTDQTNVPSSQPNADVVDTPYTSSLLRYDTQLKRTHRLLRIMGIVLSYVTASESVSLQSLIQSTETLHIDISKELEDLLSRAEIVIRCEHARPGRILDSSFTREGVERGLIALARSLQKLALKEDELEALRVRLVQLWSLATPDDV